MATGDSPASARRRLRLALRRARDAVGLTQGEVADKLHWSLSKVQRIESGDVTISVTDVSALLRLFEVNDSGRVEGLAADARLARQKGWWDEAKFRGHLTPGTLQVIQFEQSAAAIRVFQLAVFPGLLQDEKYAETTLRSTVGELLVETQKVRLEARMRRQGSFWERSDPPDYLLILDELMLHRLMGDAATSARQLNAVLGIIRRRAKVIVRLLPKEEASYLLLGAFTIYSFDDGESDVLYREHGVTDEIAHNAAEIGRFRQRFEDMWNLCLTPEATVIALEAQYASLRALLSREGSSRAAGLT